MSNTTIYSLPKLSTASPDYEPSNLAGNYNAALDLLDTAVDAAAQIKMADILILAAAVKTLKATPVQIVAAPASSYMIKPVSGSISILAGVTPFTVTNGSDLTLLWGTTNFATSKSPTLDKTILTQTSDSVGFFQVDAQMENQFDTHAHVEAVALNLANVGSGEYTAGTGNIYCRVYYQVLQVH